MRPSHQVLATAIGQLEGSRAMLWVTFRRPGSSHWSRSFLVSAGACHLTVLAQGPHEAHPTSTSAAIAYMSRDGCLALESVDIASPDRVLEPLPLFGPRAGVVDSAEEAHAAATTIQRAFFAASAARVRRVRAFTRAFATAATETLGAGRPR